MSDLVCKNCKSIAVEYEDYCGGTSYFRCKTCGQRGNKDKFTPPTVFDHITESVETLAEKFVYFEMPDDYDRDYWGSSLLAGQFWKTEAEAITATVAKLKKEYKENDTE